jgi:hypothetical protein
MTIDQIIAAVKAKGAHSAEVRWIKPYILPNGQPSPIIGGFWRCEVLITQKHTQVIAESAISQGDCLARAWERVGQCGGFSAYDPIALGAALVQLREANR